MLEALFGHLVGVNRWLNLTRIAGARDYLKLHVLDSLTLTRDARLARLAAGTPCVDLGSGGGYPGLPLARWRPQAPWVLADARRKKAEFLAAAATLLGVPAVRGRHLRGGRTQQEAPELFRQCQLVVSRAMGPGAEVLAEAEPLLRRHGHLLLAKGPAFAGEERTATLATAERLRFRLVHEHRVQLDAGDPERVIIAFERL